MKSDSFSGPAFDRRVDLTACVPRFDCDKADFWLHGALLQVGTMGFWKPQLWELSGIVQPK